MIMLILYLRKKKKRTRSPLESPLINRNSLESHLINRSSLAELINEQYKNHELQKEKSNKLSEYTISNALKKQHNEQHNEYETPQKKISPFSIPKSFNEKINEELGEYIDLSGSHNNKFLSEKSKQIYNNILLSKIPLSPAIKTPIRK
jgi:hypothetical protein